MPGTYLSNFLKISLSLLYGKPTNLAASSLFNLKTLSLDKTGFNPFNPIFNCEELGSKTTFILFFLAKFTIGKRVFADLPESPEI